MQVLTPSGYKSPASLANGNEVCAFDATGAAIINQVENIDFVDYAEWCRWWSTAASVPAFDWYRVNGAYLLFGEQSIWRNGAKVCHVRDLVVGDTIYDDADKPVAITSLETVTDNALIWYRFDISGDHSYIVDGLTVHNASRFWVSGTGTWDASTTTHWGSSSGTADSSSVPGSADAVTLDGSSGGGTVTVNATVTVQSIAMQSFTSGTLDFSVNNNNVTLSANSNAFNCSGSATRTLKLGNGTWTLTTTTASGQNVWNIGNTTNLTFQANSSTIVFNGVSAAGGGGRWFTSATSGSSISYNNLTFSGAGNYVMSLGTATTFNTLTIGGQVNLLVTQGTLTVTSIATTSTSSTPASTGGNTIGTQFTISCASGTQTLSWIALKDTAFTGGATFNATNSFDLGNNSGATITPPSGGGGGSARFSATVF